MTKNEWVDHWTDRVAGMALRGLVLDFDERPKGSGTYGAYALAIPEKVRAVLDQMYQTAQPAPAPPSGSNPPDGGDKRGQGATGTGNGTSGSGQGSRRSG